MEDAIVAWVEVNFARHDPCLPDYIELLELKFQENGISFVTVHPIFIPDEDLTCANENGVDDRMQKLKKYTPDLEVLQSKLQFSNNLKQLSFIAPSSYEDDEERG